MILESIFLWVGGILLISAVFFGIIILWLLYFHKFWYNSLISVRALYWHIAGKRLNGNLKKLEMKLGAEWWTRYKNRKYLWRCTSIEAIKK